MEWRDYLETLGFSKLGAFGEFRYRLSKVGRDGASLQLSLPRGMTLPLEFSFRPSRDAVLLDRLLDRIEVYAKFPRPLGEFVLSRKPFRRIPPLADRLIGLGWHWYEWTPSDAAGRPLGKFHCLKGREGFWPFFRA